MCPHPPPSGSPLNSSASKPAHAARKAAPFRRRLAADLIDLGPTLLLGYIFFRFQFGFTHIWPQRHFDLLDYTVEMIWSHWSLWVPGLSYTVLAGILLNSLLRLSWGRTPGEFVLSLEVITRSGEPIGPVRNLLRSVAQCLGLAFLGGGYLWAIYDKRRQSLADYASGSRLVQTQ